MEGEDIRLVLGEKLVYSPCWRPAHRVLSCKPKPIHLELIVHRAHPWRSPSDSFGFISFPVVSDFAPEGYRVSGSRHLDLVGIKEGISFKGRVNFRFDIHW